MPSSTISSRRSSSLIAIFRCHHRHRHPRSQYSSSSSLNRPSCGQLTPSMPAISVRCVAPFSVLLTSYGMCNSFSRSTNIRKRGQGAWQFFFAHAARCADGDLGRTEDSSDVGITTSAPQQSARLWLSRTSSSRRRNALYSVCAGDAARAWKRSQTTHLGKCCLSCRQISFIGVTNMHLL